MIRPKVFRIIVFLLISLVHSVLLQAKWQDKAVVGELAPEFTLQSIEGKRVRLKDFCGVSAAGSPKAVILVFIAEWCKVCHEKTLPALTNFQNKTGEKLQVLAVAVDTAPNLEHYKKLNLPYPVLLDRYNILAPRYGFNNILPLMVVITPKGRITKAWEGYKEETTEEIQIELNRVLADFFQTP